MATPRPVGYWLKLVDRMIDEQFASTLEEHGVTRRQWQLLSVLSQGPATVEQLDAAVAPFLSVAELRDADTATDSATDPDRTDVASESSAAHLTELIDSAWVDATPTGYELTERGRGAFSRLSDVVAAQRTLATEGITQQQYDDTLAALERIARNLGWND
jgi:hypothetical protein